MNPLITVSNLKVYFPVYGGLLRRVVDQVKAVDEVSFTVGKGQTVGLVGESGSGKSTIGKSIVQLVDISGGEIEYDGKKISTLHSKDFLPYRKRIQMIFQDPYNSLNPRMTVEQIIGEPLEIHFKQMSKPQRRVRIEELLELVGLKKEHIDRYPHEFSGGQRQRIGIARALVIRPDVVLCDEPISALDVSIQAQIVNLLGDLQRELDLTYLFIAHDLSMVRHMADRVGVMYLGQLVETAPAEELYARPLHPYTTGLLASVPVPDPNQDLLARPPAIEGDVPSPINPPPGCRFSTRCPKAMARCREEVPAPRDVGDGHSVACHLHTGPRLPATAEPSPQPVVGPPQENQHKNPTEGEKC
jgi:oligopeptide transport system ATP-binding protein